MVDLGFTHKEVYGDCQPAKCDGDEKVYPSIDVSGEHAIAMGAEDLKAGDVVEVPVVLRVKRHSKTEEGDEIRYSMCLCIEKMGDMVEVESESDDDESTSEESSEDVANLRATLAMDDDD